ncbi:MAG TPA: phosphatidylglycerophosphatase A [Sulfurospirillum sp. UBA11407]|jgi:phosphatidylglycerophosphatase A|nr:MAG TPA: phosphatidylglycerophosphatase A [Sulfurospirillum sp. UBA11407]
MQRLFLTFFYSGLSPVAPGTIGSLAAGLVGYLILLYFPTDTLFLLAVLISVIGIQEINKYEKATNTHDDKSIVIDEVAGLWIAFSFTSNSLIELVLAFLFFRLYDIYKPSLIGKIDREYKGGIGVMGDDILAGILAGISTLIVFQLYSHL